MGSARSRRSRTNVWHFRVRAHACVYAGLRVCARAVGTAAIGARLSRGRASMHRATLSMSGHKYGTRERARARARERARERERERERERKRETAIPGTRLRDMASAHGSSPDHPCPRRRRMPLPFSRLRGVVCRFAHLHVTFHPGARSTALNTQEWNGKERD